MPAAEKKRRDAESRKRYQDRKRLEKLKARAPITCANPECDGGPFVVIRQGGTLVCSDACRAEFKQLNAGKYRKPGRSLAASAARTSARQAAIVPGRCVVPGCDSGLYSSLRSNNTHCHDACYRAASTARESAKGLAERAAILAALDNHCEVCGDEFTRGRATRRVCDKPTCTYHLNLAHNRQEGIKHANRRRVRALDSCAKFPDESFPVYAEAGWWRAHGVEMVVDHWQPISKGGPHSPANLVLLLNTDNAQKYNLRPYVDWTPPAYYTDLPGP